MSTGDVALLILIILSAVAISTGTIGLLVISCRQLFDCGDEDDR